MKRLDDLKTVLSTIKHLPSKIEKLQASIGRIEARQNESLDSKNLNEHEFSVYSQWGEDGILQFLTRQVSMSQKVFIEFGVENYLESNTRFLLENNYWSGLIIDGSPAHIEFVKNHPLYWRHNLKAECAFVTAENINELFTRNGLRGDIGILSIDIDGNDYWVWKSIESVHPRIVVCEYNSTFGPTAKLTIPYDKAFTRTSSHYSNLYYGASIAAFDDLARKKGYTLVGANEAGINAFFVRNDVLGDLKPVTPQQAYRQSLFRESRDADGSLTFLDFKKRTEILAEMPIFELESERVHKIKEVI